MIDYLEPITTFVAGSRRYQWPKAILFLLQDERNDG